MECQIGSALENLRILPSYLDDHLQIRDASNDCRRTFVGEGALRVDAASMNIFATEFTR